MGFTIEPQAFISTKNRFRSYADTAFDRRECAKARHTMKITLIDADPILWKGIYNIRLINLTELIRKIYKEEKQDKIYLVGAFNDHNWFLQTLTETAKLSNELQMETITTYSKSEGKNIYSFGVMNMLYQSFMAQENITDNTYTIVAANTYFLDAAAFFEDRGGNKVNFILTDDIPDLKFIAEKFNLIHTIKVKPTERSVFDKTIIKQILNIIQLGEADGNINTLASLSDKCEKFSNIARYKTLFLTHALIYNKYLERRPTVFNGAPTTIIVPGAPEKIDQLLKEL